MRVLLAVMVGAACGFAIKNTLDMPYGVWLQQICYLGIFLSIIIRFFQGNIIYYSKTHMVPSGSTGLVEMNFDFLLILLQCVLFLGIGYYIGKLYEFLIAIAVLNIVDFLWHGIAFLKSTNDETKRTSASWSLSNLAFAITIGLAFLMFGNALVVQYTDKTLVVFALLGMIAFLFDYIYNKSFYFNAEARRLFEGF